MILLRPALSYSSIAVFLCTILLSGVCAAAEPSPLSSFENRPVFNDISITNPANAPIKTALPVDLAFSLSAIVEMPSNVILMWEIKEGYYLYRKSIQVIDSNNSSLKVTLPKGETINDEFFGDVDVFYDKLIVNLPFNKEQAGSSSIQLQLSYQGCAEIGFCYPMQQKQIDLELP